MSVTHRLAAIEEAIAADNQLGELPASTLRGVLVLAREDEVFVELLRIAAHIESVPSFRVDSLRQSDEHVWGILQQLGIEAELAPENKLEAVEGIRRAANERMHRNITERFGANIAAHYFSSH